MARISLDPPRTLTYRLAAWYARRRYGTDLEPAAALAHNPKVMKTTLRAEMSLTRWRRLPPELSHLAVMAAAVTVGCSWCVDFGYWVGSLRGVDPGKVRDVPRWRESSAY